MEEALFSQIVIAAYVIIGLLVAAKITLQVARLKRHWLNTITVFAGVAVLWPAWAFRDKTPANTQS